jgi:Na+-driven multidrug efflux pump
MSKSADLGTQKIPTLLAAQSIPAAIGFMVMTLNMVVDTIFVGQYIGKLAIGAISVVMPISFLNQIFTRIFVSRGSFPIWDLNHGHFLCP